MLIRALMAAHWPQVCVIYEQGIATGHATFQTGAPTWEAWDRDHLAHSRLVALAGAEAGGREGLVAGWAALSAVSGRSVYKGVAEVSVYVAPEAAGRGLGRQLLAALVAESEANGLWTLQASIFPENEASLRLHAGLGFREVGRRERIGQQHGIWRSTVLLERRSTVVGN